MAPVNVPPMVNMPFQGKLSSSQLIHSFDECEKIENFKIKRQNSTSFPEQQDTKDVSSMEEYKRSLTLFPTCWCPVQPQIQNSVVPIEHPLSPDAKRGIEVDEWLGQTLALEKYVSRGISYQKKAVEHEFDEVYPEALQTIKENDDPDGQKATEKTTYPKGNEEKQSVLCTEDNEELLIVALPPLPVEGRTSHLQIEENNNILPESVKGGQKQLTTRTTQTKTKHSPRPRRHIAGKAKRNQYYVTDPSPSPPPKKRRKVKEKCPVKKPEVLNNESNEDLENVAKPHTDTVQKLKKRGRKKAYNSRMKPKQEKKEKQQVKTEKQSESFFQTSELKEFVKPAVRNSFVPSYVNKTNGKKYYKVYGVPQSEPTDSGVDSGNSGSFNGNGNNSKDNKDDVPQSGNGGNGGFGGGGNKNNGRDDDDDNDKKQPWRNGSQITDSSEEEEKMETDEDDCSSDNAISKEPVKAQPALCGKYVPDMQGIDQMVVRTKLQPPKYTVTDVRHAAYCNKGTCQNTNCWKLKAEFEHLKTHNKHDCCERCSSCRSIIELHAKTCPLPSCRVPLCVELKKNSKKNKIKEPTHTPVQLQQNAADCIPPQFGFHNEQHSKLPMFQSQLHGKVLLQNSAHFPPEGSFFQEHINYHVKRDKPLGNGTNGKVYQVYADTSSHKSQELAMKVTNYEITEEELKVYKTLGTVHENIVPTYGVTSSGSKDCACIFMQKCDKSLWDVLNIKYPQKLTVEDAMFYVSQVLEAVDYMHRNCVIHRDIKAKNVMLFKKQDFVRAKLGDMDSAKCLEDEFTKSGLAPVGTRGFAAKEVLQQLPHGRPADIYSIGCFIVELTVGVPTQDTLQQKIEKLRELDPVLADIVHQCVSEDVKQRPTAKMLLAHPRFAKYKMARDIPLEV